MIKIDTKEIRKFRRVMKRAAMTIMTEVNPVLQDFGRKIGRKAIPLAPRRTGTLQGSMVVNIRKTIRVSFKVPYARHVEFGTKVMQAQPFIAPPFDDGIAENDRNLGRAAEKALKRIARF